MTFETLFPVMLKEFSNLIKELGYLNTLKITRHQMFFFLYEPHSFIAIKKQWSDNFQREIFYSYGTTSPCDVTNGFLGSNYL